MSGIRVGRFVPISRKTATFVHTRRDVTLAKRLELPILTDVACRTFISNQLLLAICRRPFDAVLLSYDQAPNYLTARLMTTSSHGDTATSRRDKAQRLELAEGTEVSLRPLLRPEVQCTWRDVRRRQIRRRLLTTPRNRRALKDVQIPPRNDGSVDP